MKRDEILTNRHFIKCFSGKVTENLELINYFLDAQTGKIAFIEDKNFQKLISLFKNLDKFFYKNEIYPRVRFVDGKKLKRLDDIDEGDFIVLDMQSLKSDINIESLLDNISSENRMNAICLFEEGQRLNLSLAITPDSLKVYAL